MGLVDKTAEADGMSETIKIHSKTAENWKLQIFKEKLKHISLPIKNISVIIFFFM